MCVHAFCRLTLAPFPLNRPDLTSNIYRRKQSCCRLPAQCQHSPLMFSLQSRSAVVLFTKVHQKQKWRRFRFGACASHPSWLTARRENQSASGRLVTPSTWACRNWPYKKLQQRWRDSGSTCVSPVSITPHRVLLAALCFSFGCVFFCPHPISFPPPPSCQLWDFLKTLEGEIRRL